MKLLPIVIAICVKCSLGELDMVVKCPDFNPLPIFDFQELLGDWFTLEMVTHYARQANFLQAKGCVRFKLHIGPVEASEKHPHQKHIDFSVRNEISVETEKPYIFNYTYRVSGTKHGLWMGSDSHANLQVIMVEGNFSVLIFCERVQLVSFILSRDESADADEEIEDAHNMLKKRGLLLENVEPICRGSSIFCFRLPILLIVLVAMRIFT